MNLYPSAQFGNPKTQTNQHGKAGGVVIVCKVNVGEAGCEVHKGHATQCQCRSDFLGFEKCPTDPHEPQQEAQLTGQTPQAVINQLIQIFVVNMA